MGSQSTLLLLIGGIIVAAGIYAGITVFTGSNVHYSRDQICTEIANLSKEAVNFYVRPRQLGGGGKSFKNFNNTRRTKISTKKRRKTPSGTRLWESETAVYSVIAAADDSVVIDAIGDHIGNDGTNPIRIRGVIKGTGFTTTDIN